MADGDVKYRFFADTAAAEKAIITLEKTVERLENRLKSSAKTSKKSNDDMLSGMKDLQSLATGLAATYLSIDGAVSLVAAGYRAWTADVDRLSDALGKANKELRAQLVAAGDFAAGGRIKAFLQNVPGATQAQAQGVFGAVTGAAPELDLARRLAITGNAARVLPIAGEARAAQVAGLAGDIGAMIPGKSADDLTDFALSIQGALGERAGEANQPAFEKAFGQLLNAGMSGEQSAALLVNAMQSGLGPKNLSQIASKLDASKGITMASLFGGDERFRRKSLGAQGATAFGLLNQQAITGLEGTFTAAQSGDLTNAALQQAIATDPNGVARELAASAEEKGLRPMSERMQALGTAQQMRRAQSTNPLIRGALQASEVVENAQAYTGFSELPSWLQAAIGTSINPAGGLAFGAGAALSGNNTRSLISGSQTGAQEAGQELVVELRRLNATLEQNNRAPAINRQANSE